MRPNTEILMLYEVADYTPDNVDTYIVFLELPNKYLEYIDGYSIHGLTPDIFENPEFKEYLNQ